MANNLKGSDHIYATLLSSGDSEKIRLAAKWIYQYEPKSTVLLDIAAEVLLQGSQNKIDIRTDSMSWLAKSLGKSNSKRYLQILNLIKNNMEKLSAATVESNTQPEFKFARGFEEKNDLGMANIIDHSKTINYIENAIHDLTEDSQQKYSPGDTNFGLLKNTLNKALMISSKGRTNEKFLDITSQHDIAHVYNMLGLPDSQSLNYYWYKRSRWAGGAWVSKVLKMELKLNYKKLGSITIYQKDSDKPLAVKRIASTIAYEQASNNNEEQTEKQILVDSINNFENGAILSRLGYRVYHEKLFDVEILDAMLRRVSNDMHTNNAGAFTIFLKNIGSSGNVKYIPALQLIMNESKTRRVRNWAERAIEMLGGEPKVNEREQQKEEEF